MEGKEEERGQDAGLGQRRSQARRYSQVHLLQYQCEAPPEKQRRPVIG